MKYVIANDIRVEQPSQEVISYANAQLILDNPEYAKKERMGYWTGETPKKICLFSQDVDTLILPYGCLSDLWKFKPFDYETHFAPTQRNLMEGSINLYPYQQRALEALLRGKNGVLEAPCGSGKTQIGLALIKALGLKTLWLTHTQKLLLQSKQRCEAYFKGDFGTITEGKANIGRDITFATIQTMSKLDTRLYKDAFNVVVVDECFPYYEKVTTKDGAKRICDIEAGDEVLSYNEERKETEWKKVVRKFEKKPTSLVCVKTEGGKKIYCTINHKFFTEKEGWKEAKELNGNDKILQDMRETFDEGSREVLQCGMRKEKPFVDNGEDKQEIRFGKNEKEKSYETREVTEKNVQHIEENALEAERAWWKREAVDDIAEEFGGSVGKEVLRGNGIRCANEDRKGARVSDMLQDRHRIAVGNGGNRSGREFPLLIGKASAGQEEGRFLAWQRVESVSVQERGSDGTFVGMRGTNIVYNIEVEDNHNYFVDGVLVHNCHHCAGTPTQVHQFYKVVTNCNARYKYGMSATLARGDGLIRSVFAILGEKLHTITSEEIGDKIIRALHQEFPITWKYKMEEYCAYDGTLDYAKMIDAICNCKARNYQIATNVIKNRVVGKRQLILTARVSHAQELQKLIPNSSLCVGNIKEKNRDYSNNVIIATYALAKEGLDIPDLDVLHLATPTKDKATIVQSVGRIERNTQGKSTPICYDYVDEEIPYCVNAFKKRRSILKRR